MKQSELEKLIENKVKNLLKEGYSTFDIKKDRVFINIYNDVDKAVEWANKTDRNARARKEQDNVVSVDLWAAVKYYVDNTF